MAVCVKNFAPLLTALAQLGELVSFPGCCEVLGERVVEKKTVLLAVAKQRHWGKQVAQRETDFGLTAADWGV